MIKKLLIIVNLLLLLPHLSLAARLSPVDGGTVTSGVGWRIDPFGSGRMVHHSGYDIAVPAGTPVHPTQAGTVYFAGEYKGYGNLVVVEHGAGYVTMYGHNSEVLAKAGERVDTDTVIALSGNTGRSTGPHVHYEIRQLPGFAGAGRDKVRTFMAERAGGAPVGDVVQGKGGGEEETFLPAALEE